MLTLTIDFQDGFADETIILDINDEVVFHKKHVNTNALVGLADSLKTEVEIGTVNIKINVLTKNIIEAFPLEISADTFMGISIMNGRIEYVILGEPFGYG